MKGSLTEDNALTTQHIKATVPMQKTPQKNGDQLLLPILHIIVKLCKEVHNHSTLNPELDQNGSGLLLTLEWATLTFCSEIFAIR